MKKKVLILVLGALVMSSCGLYRKYESRNGVPEDVYGTVQRDTTANIAETGWRQMFTDARLQDLIDTALACNTDAKTALMRIEQAEVRYSTSRLAYLPTVAFSPTATVSHTEGMGRGTAYSLAGNVSWQLDVFGARITNSRRKAKASLQYARDYEQAVQCRLISSVASLYCDLLRLDRQAEIQEEMISLYMKTYESVQTLFEAGLYKSPAVKQTEAQLEQLKVDLIDIRHAILMTEHTMCELLDQPYHPIVRGRLEQLVMPAQVGTGIPADLLRLRPDVRVAERNIEMAYYDVLLSKGAMYPSITLTANGGWQKLMTTALSDPKVWFIQGIGSLAQPIFMGGRLRADLKVSRINQRIAVEEFRKTVIKAGHEVTTALSKCQKAMDREPHIMVQLEAQQETVMANHELMENGTSTYLEVLTSLQDLLKVENAQLQNRVAGMQALIELYSALGGK